jgi:hypothetical protein
MLRFFAPGTYPTMKNRTASVGGGLVLSALALAVGCQSSPPPAPPVAQPSPQEKGEHYRVLRSQYLAANPGSQVGVVIATLPANKLAGVRDVDYKQFTVGDILSIVDDQMNILANARVVKVDTDLLQVEYDRVFGASREPEVGDIAIRAVQPKPTVVMPK